MSVSREKTAVVAQRRREILIMKIQGRTAAQIAEHFNMSPGTARSDLSRAIKKARELEVQEAELYRYIQGARLEELLRAVMPAATRAEDPDLKASEQARKLIVDITDLFGLKVPVRTEISGPDGGAIPFNGGELAELNSLFGVVGQEGVPAPSFVLGTVESDDDEEGDAEDDEDEDYGDSSS